jgi:Ca2+-binding EF-hand superfamily protein
MQLRPRHLLFLAVLCIGLAPDALAQRRGGARRGGGRAGGRANSGVFGTPRRGGGTIPNSPLGTGAVNPPTPTASAPKGATMAAGEKRFLDLVAQIDKALAVNERRLQASAEGDLAGAVTLPAEVKPGTQEWRQLQRPVFLGIDYDESGWLSYRELRDAIDCDRAEFELYDRDHDGRVSSREFMTRYDEVVARSGVFRAPRPKPASEKDEPRSADALRQAFDADGDGALDVVELGTLVANGGAKDVERESKALLRAADVDADGRLAGEELFQLSRILSYARATPDIGLGQGTKSVATSLEELFGRVEERPSTVSSAGLPPWIPGPVPHFRRLDLDGNGKVDTEDLRRLQGSASLGARTGAVLAALDLNEDGAIDEREFAAALATPPRRAQ